VSSDESTHLEVVDFSTLTMARPIGKGGFATVWMARWQGTTLAVKVLHVANENFDGSALQEVAILRRLRHPCICALFGHMRFEQQPALVLEYMAGGSLAAYLFQPSPTSNGHVQTGLHDAFSRGLSSLASLYHRVTSGARSISAREAAPDGYTLQEAPRYPRPATPDFDKHLGFAVQLASGLSFLHSNGILHCDVKTDNALLDVTLTVCKLADFGLARLSLNQVRRTGGGAGLPWGGGTLRYLAPEIVEANNASLERGDCSSVSSKHRTLVSCADRTDVYAFALLLYELLHERRAFEAMSGIDACLSAMRGQRPPISLPPNLHGLADLMQESWAQRPEDRPIMSTVLERLEACMQAHCVRSGKPPQSVISEDHAHGHAEACSSRPTHVEASSSRPTAEASSSRPTAEASSSRPTAAPSKTDQIGEHIQRNLQFWRNLNIHQP
jgi:serine/threonine protein kinase